MNNIARLLTVSLASVFAATAPAQSPAAPATADVKVTQAADHSVTITGASYEATIDSSGNLARVTVKGVQSLTHRFTPAAGAPSVNVIGNTVAVRSGAARDEWTFGENGVHLLTEGYEFNCFTDATKVVSVVVPGGQSQAMKLDGIRPQDYPWFPNTTALILANGLTVGYTIPFHVHGSGRMFPTLYADGSVPKGGKLEFDWKLGGVAAGADLLNDFRIEGVGADDSPLKEHGNRTRGIVHFAGGAPVRLAGHLTNIGASDMNVEYRLRVVDHYAPWKGGEVFTGTQKAVMKAKADALSQFELPKLSPGFYYATLQLWNQAGKVFDSQLTFAVDLPHYTHPLTRPPDFEQFWQERNRELVNTPLAPVETLLGNAANPNKACFVTLGMPKGKMSALLRVGADVQPGVPTTATIASDISASFASQVEAARKPDFKWSGVTLTVLLPEDATYSRWNSAQYNNLLECILIYVRGVDYLVSRPGVNPQGIRLFGASRSGPLAFITAALRPRNVASVETHVPTSAGISWTDKPYYSWGMPPGYHAQDDPNELKRWTPMAAYVDPVNFAPNVVAPLALAYGIDDGLSRPPGIEVMYHLAASKWKRIARNGGGHQYSPEFQALEKELGEYVGLRGKAGDTTGIMTQH